MRRLDVCLRTPTNLRQTLMKSRSLSTALGLSTPGLIVRRRVLCVWRCCAIAHSTYGLRAGVSFLQVIQMRN